MRLADAAATEAVGAKLAALVRPGDVVALSGPLGAGKTSVARGLLAALDGGAPAWAAGAVEGFAAARVGPARESALSRWEDVAAAKAFWDGPPHG